MLRNYRKTLISLFRDLNQFSTDSKEFYEDGQYFLRMDNPKTLMRDIKVSHHFMGRLGAEFLSLKWMIEELCAWATEPPIIDTGTMPFMPSSSPN